MRFMMLMYPGERAEHGELSEPACIAAMMKYNEELTNAGVLLSLDGLQSSAKGARITFDAGSPVVTDGPFAETKELLGSYWMLRVSSKEEAIAWAKRCPAVSCDRIELRQVFEIEDFNLEPGSDLGKRLERVEAAMAQAQAA
jgi:hypothetical protein